MKTSFIADLISGEILNKFKSGREVMDPNPAAETLKFKRQPTYFEQMRAQVRAEISRAADEQGFETFEEANDFNIGDDFEPYSRHEETFGPDGLSDFERGSFQIPVEGGGGSLDPEGGGKPPAKLSKDKPADPDSDPLD